MVDTLLFEQFATLATAPDGIGRLRELILQLAVQGKLGTQDASDEPASVLASKILEEKKRLIKKGIISKSRALPEIESEEIPFQVPSSWKWLRLNDVGHTWGQKEPDEIFTYIDVTAINKERGLIGDEVNVLQPNEAPSRARKLVKNGTVIYSTVRPYLLNIAIIDKDFNPEPIVSTAFAVLHPFEGISNRYLFYYLRSKPFIEYVESQMTGMAYPAINDLKFHMGLIPVPPTAEQHRIVAKVDRLMALCDELEARQQQQRAGCLKLGIASFAGLQNAESPEEFGRQWAQVCDAFDQSLDCSENVAVLRQTILQLAVQGRLVRQDPGDEPAGRLVEWIRKEKEQLVMEGKAKRDKSIERLEIVSYKMPDGWQLCQLGQISEIIMGNSPPGDTYNTSRNGVPLINGPTEFSKNSLGKTIVSQYTTQPTKYCKENDLLICVRGATTGRTNIAGFDACIGRGVAVIRSHSIQPYLNLVILTKAQQIFNMGTGSTFPSISQKDLITILVPLPPLAEQHRIVAKVDALMALCDQLEAQLKERAGMQGKFTDAVVKSIGTG